LARTCSIGWSSATHFTVAGVGAVGIGDRICTVKLATAAGGAGTRTLQIATTTI